LFGDYFCEREFEEIIIFFSDFQNAYFSEIVPIKRDNVPIKAKIVPINYDE